MFDAGFGELFIVRIAGNIISPEIMGTLQYAAVHLHTPLFVVLGHEGCGAVQAAVATKWHGARERDRIARLLDIIMPGLPEQDPALSPEDEMARSRGSQCALVDESAVRNAEGGIVSAEGVRKLVGAVYELKTGRVRFLP